jgi:hypothetical protein
MILFRIAHMAADFSVLPQRRVGLRLLQLSNSDQLLLFRLRDDHYRDEHFFSLFQVF